MSLSEKTPGALKPKKCHPKVLNLSEFPQLQEVTPMQLYSASTAPALLIGPSCQSTFAPTQTVWQNQQQHYCAGGRSCSRSCSPCGGCRGAAPCPSSVPSSGCSRQLAQRTALPGTEATLPLGSRHPVEPTSPDKLPLAKLEQFRRL